MVCPDGTRARANALPELSEASIEDEQVWCACTICDIVVLSMYIVGDTVLKK